MSKKMLKLVIAGDGGVGKTTLIQRYLTGLFDQNIKITIGVDIFKKNVNLPEYGEFLLQIWDFGGEERFRNLLPPYMSGSHGVIFMFSITDPSSLFNFKEWLKVLRTNELDIPILFVGAKADLYTSRKIQAYEARRFAQKNNCVGYIEVSSKTGMNVEKVFQNITKEMWIKINKKNAKILDI